MRPRPRRLPGFGALRRRAAAARRRGELQREQRCVLAESVLDSTATLVCVVDPAGRVVLANPALLELTGYEEREVLGRCVWDVLVIPEDLEPARAGLRATVATRVPSLVEADWLDRAGGRHRIAIQTSVVLGPGRRVRGVAYVGTDVTEQRLAQAELRRRADTDALTGLRNRAAVSAAVAASLQPDGGAGPERVVGLLFCDLDGFKRVNDEHGHLVGDGVLVEVARRLLAITREPDVVGRLGGDEFLVLAPDTTPSALAELGRTIEEAVTEPCATGHGMVTVGVSVGTALGRVGDSADHLISEADRHMYGIKTTRSRPWPGRQGGLVQQRQQRRGQPVES